MDLNITVSKRHLTRDTRNLAETTQPCGSVRGSLVRKVNNRPRVRGRSRGKGITKNNKETKTPKTGCTNPNLSVTTASVCNLNSVDIPLMGAESVILECCSIESNEGYRGGIKSMVKGGHVARSSFTSVRDKNSEKADEPDNSKKCVTNLKVSAADSDPSFSEQAKVSPQNVPDIPELSMSDFTVQFENEQPKKQSRRHAKDQTFRRNRRVGVPSPSTQKPDIPELNMSDFTIQFEDELQNNPNRGQRVKDVPDKTLCKNEGVGVPASSIEIKNSPNLPELNMSDFTIQFEDEQPKNKKRQGEENVCSTKKKRRCSRMSTDIDLANVIISPVVDSPDLLLPMPSIRRSSRLRRKSVELYRSCMKASETMSDIANARPKGSDSEPTFSSPAASGSASSSCVLSESESCNFSPKTLETRYSSVLSTPGDYPQVHVVKCNEEELLTPDASKIEHPSSMESEVKSDETVVHKSLDIDCSVKCNFALESNADVTVSLNMEDNVCQGDAGDTLVNYLKTDEPAVREKESDRKRASESSAKRPVRARPQRILVTQSPSTPDTPSPQIKKSRRRSKGKEPEISLEDLYRNKNFKMPELRSWETIYESPGPGQGDFGKKKLKRSLMFEEDANMQAKYKKRRKRAIKNGWKPLSKAKLEKADKKLLEKLKTFEEELELLNFENSEAKGISTITSTALANVGGCDRVEKDALYPAVQSDPLAMMGVNGESSEFSPSVCRGQASETGDGEGGTEEDSDTVFSPPSDRQILPLESVERELGSVTGLVCQEDNVCFRDVIQDDKTCRSCSGSSPGTLVDQKYTQSSASPSKELSSKGTSIVTSNISVSFSEAKHIDCNVSKTKEKGTDSTNALGEKLEDGCCVWRENTCDWSYLSTVTTGSLDVACLEEDISVPGDGSVKSNQPEDQCFPNICSTDSPEDSKNLPSDASRSPTNDVAPLKSANVESPETTDVVANNNESNESFKGQSSTSTLNSVPNQPPEKDTNDNRQAKAYKEKMNIFQNIFS